MSEGKHIFITGASQGIGEAIAYQFAKEPDSSLSLIARNEEELKRVANTCREFGAAVSVFPCDVTCAETVIATVRSAEASYGGVDLLINNAGCYAAKPFLEMDASDLDFHLGINLRSVFLVSQAILPGMLKERQGDIINILSIASLQALPDAAGYCTAKAGLLGLTRSMRGELKSHGIRVIGILPGATATPSWDGSGVDPELMMPAQDIAETCFNTWKLSRKTVVEDIVLRPIGGDV